MKINNIILVLRTRIILLSSFVIYFFCICHSGRFPIVKAKSHTHLPPLRSDFESRPGRQFTAQNLDQLYVLVSSALPTPHHNITDKVLGVT